MTLTIQSIRVRNTISRSDANKIIKKLGYNVTPINKNNPQYKNYHSYRQIQPKEFIKDSFRMKTLKRRGQTKLIMVVLGRRIKK